MIAILSEQEFTAQSLAGFLQEKHPDVVSQCRFFSMKQGSLGAAINHLRQKEHCHVIYVYETKVPEYPLPGVSDDPEYDVMYTSEPEINANIKPFLTFIQQHTEPSPEVPLPEDGWV
jgi:hypothetical protein